MEAEPLADIRWHRVRGGRVRAERWRGAGIAAAVARSAGFDQALRGNRAKTPIDRF